MRSKICQFRTLLILSLVALPSCIKPGDFCDVVRGPITFEESTAAAIGRTDVPAARRLAVQNAYGATHCHAVGWQ